MKRKPTMRKATAIRLLGGSTSAAAEAVGITPSAVRQWPDPLPIKVEDRVQAAIYRLQQAIVAGR